MTIVKSKYLQRKQTVRFEWDDIKYLKAFEQAVDKVLEKGAKGVLDDARKILTSKSKHPTGTLARQIRLSVSKFKDGGYIVDAQGPSNYQKYYALFVELGTHDRKTKKGSNRGSTKAIPFLRPAIKRARYRMRKLMENEIGLIIK
jgi:hypothetical protein